MDSYLALCAEYYDLDKPQPPADALGFYRAFCEEAGGPILEAMCGSGRYLVPLARAGFDIDGIDASPHMLARCKARLHQENLASSVQLQSLHELELGRSYALAFIAGGSFLLIVDDEEALECMKRLYRRLTPGGRLLIETCNSKPAVSSSWPWSGKWIDRPDGAKIVMSWMGSYDASTGISQNMHRYELVQDGKLLNAEFEEFNLRYRDLAELSSLIERAGFEISATYPQFLREPAKGDEPDLVLECRPA